MLTTIRNRTNKVFKKPLWKTFEFGDMDNAPKWYHLYLRKYLVFFYQLFGYYKLWIPSFEKYIQKTKPEKIIEFCAGSGDALPLIVSKMDLSATNKIQFHMSDLKPRKEFYEKFTAEKNNVFTYNPASIDATQPSQENKCPKLFINSFHHFPEKLAKKILHNNLKNGNDVIIFEYCKSSFLGYMSMFSGTFILLLSLPFVVKLKDLPLMALFTYIIPIFPCMFLWDGLTSCYRVYSNEKIKELVKDIPLENITVTNDERKNLLYPAGTNAIYISSNQSSRIA